MKVKLTKPGIVKKLYQTLFDVITILEQHDITYWAIGGTLLGAVRHKGMIPWDDDADIGIMRGSVQRFLDLAPVFKKCGYEITKVWFGYKVFRSNGRQVPDANYKFPFVDVFVYRKSGNRIVQNYKTARESWPKEWYAPKQLSFLPKLPFGDFYISTPSFPLSYLDRMYGKDWNRVAYAQYDHATDTALKPVKFNLLDKHRKPAQPTDIVDRRCLYKTAPRERETALMRRVGINSLFQGCLADSDCKNNFNDRMGVYVINCDIHEKRLRKFKKHAKRAGVVACREQCVNGKAFTDKLLSDMVKQGLLDSQAEMTPIEVAISLSHYNSWLRIINNCENYGLVIEDDAEMKASFVDDVNRVMDHLHAKELNFDILFLWNGNWMDTPKKLVTHVNKRLTVVKEIYNYNAGAVAYIISAKFAKYLVEHFFPIRYPVDLYIGSKVRHGRHLSLKMGYRKSDECYLSPVLSLSCGGEYGTGESTQDYSQNHIKQKLFDFNTRRLADNTVDQLRIYARRKGLVGRSTMNKPELIRELHKL